MSAGIYVYIFMLFCGASPARAKNKMQIMLWPSDSSPALHRAHFSAPDERIHVSFECACIYRVSREDSTVAMSPEEERKKNPITVFLFIRIAT